MLTRERRRKRKSAKPKIRDYKKERKGLGRGKPRPNTRKVLRPSKEELEKMIREMPMVRIAKKYNVTDNAIRKWCKYLQIDFKKIKAIVCQEQSNNSQKIVDGVATTSDGTNFKCSYTPRAER